MIHCLPMTEKHRIDGKVVIDALDPVIETILNKIDREWPPGVRCHPDSRLYLKGFAAIARNLFRTIRFLCATEGRENEPERRIEYTKSAPPLSRVMLEILYNTAYVLEDMPTRTVSFEKAGWRNMSEDVARFKAESEGDPD